MVEKEKVNKSRSNNNWGGFGSIISVFLLFPLSLIATLVIAWVTLKEISTTIVTAWNAVIIIWTIIIGILFSASIADSYKKDIRMWIFIKVSCIFIILPILTWIFLNHSPRTCEEVVTQEIITSTCSRTVYWKTYTKTSYRYTQSYKLAHPEQFSSSSSDYSSSDSSSSFDGWWGSSNGGGYGD